MWGDRLVSLLVLYLFNVLCHLSAGPLRAGSIQIESILLSFSLCRMIFFGKAVPTPGSGPGAGFCRIML